MQPLPLGLDKPLRWCYNNSMKKTEKPPRLTIYIPPRVRAALRQEAARQYRSLNAQVVWCLEQCLGVQQEEQVDVPGETGQRRQDRPTR